MENAVNLFNTWAKKGKDIKMANSHEPSTNSMLSIVSKNNFKKFSFLDAGCGNGKVVRSVREGLDCIYSVGVDGAQEMINNARRLDYANNYFCSELLEWIPGKKFDVVFSMEVFYYFKDLNLLFEHVVSRWLNTQSMLIIGVDFFLENKASHSWPSDLGVEMTLLSKNEWLAMFKKYGFSNCEAVIVNETSTSAGTLVVSGLLN